MASVGVGYAVTYYAQTQSADNDVDSDKLDVYISYNGTPISSALQMPKPTEGTTAELGSGYTLSIVSPNTANNNKVKMAIWADCDPRIWIILDHITVTLDPNGTPKTFTFGAEDSEGIRNTGIPSSEVQLDAGKSSAAPRTYDLSIQFVYKKTYASMSTEEQSLFGQDMNLVYLIGINGVYSKVS